MGRGLGPAPQVTESAPARASLLAQTSGASLAEARLRAAVRLTGTVGYRKAFPLAAAGFPRRTADMAWPGRRIAVFYDGCFWHGCELHRSKCLGGSDPDYWRQKIARNAERDRETRTALAAAGWVVLTVWEHEDVAAAAETISRIVQEAAGRAVRRCGPERGYRCGPGARLPLVDPR